MHHITSLALSLGCRGTLAAGQAAPLSVVYTPATAGTFSCQSFQVLSSGGNKVGTSQAASCQTIPRQMPRRSVSRSYSHARSHSGQLVTAQCCRYCTESECSPAEQPLCGVELSSSHRMVQGFT